MLLHMKIETFQKGTKKKMKNLYIKIGYRMAKNYENSKTVFKKICRKQ